MTANITISFTDEDEFLLHLSVIRQQAKKAFKKDPEATEYELSDSNCYGWHKVKITED